MVIFIQWLYNRTIYNFSIEQQLISNKEFEIALNQWLAYNILFRYYYYLESFGFNYIVYSRGL